MRKQPVSRLMIILFGIGVLTGTPANAAENADADTNLTAGSFSERELPVAENVTLAGLLKPDATQHAKSLDALVVDLRTLPEGTVDEAINMSDSGVTYFNLPIGSDGLDQATLSAFEKILESSGGRQIILHCRSGARAGLLWAAHLVENGSSNESALSTVNDIITSDMVREAITSYQPQTPENP